MTGARPPTPMKPTPFYRVLKPSLTGRTLGHLFNVPARSALALTYGTFLVLYGPGSEPERGKDKKIPLRLVTPRDGVRSVYRPERKIVENRLLSNGD